MQDVTRPPLPPAGNEGTGSHHPNDETLNAFVDGELTPRERVVVQTHLATCASCQDEVRGLKATMSLLQGLPELRPRRSFQLTPEMAAQASGTVSSEQRPAPAPIVPFRPKERPETSEERTVTQDEGAAGAGKVTPFSQRTRYLAAIAAALVFIVVGAAFISQMNDGGDTSNGSDGQMPAAVMASDDADSAEPTLTDDEALLARDAVAPSRQRGTEGGADDSVVRDDPAVYATAPRADTQAEPESAAAEADDSVLAVPSPTLVPLPPPPAVLPTDTSTDPANQDSQRVGASFADDRAAMETAGGVRPAVDSSAVSDSFALVDVESLNASTLSDTDAPLYALVVNEAPLSGAGN